MWSNLTFRRQYVDLIPFKQVINTLEDTKNVLYLEGAKKKQKLGIKPSYENSL